MAEKKAHPPISTPLAWTGLLLSWLIPGSGFMIYGRWTRGLLQFAIVVLTFVLGLVLHSGVLWPIWSYKSEDFNLINNFTFIVELLSGLPALASFWASSVTPVKHAWLAGAQVHPYYELGTYFMIVAGALNYFALGNFYDRIVRLHPRFEAQELGTEGAAA